MDKIRQAVMASRGLPDDTTDAQVRAIWNSLDEDTQKQYMAKIGEKDVSDNDGGNVRNSTPRAQGARKPPDVRI